MESIKPPATESRLEQPLLSEAERSELGSGDKALQDLIAGNERFIAGNTIHPNQSPDIREELARGQSPKVAVIGCADSRVSPEIVFDQGLGDLFVTRVAGNVANDMILGSLEFAVERFGVELIVVLGHERCGAISAAVQGGTAPGHIGSIVEAIAPAVAKTNELDRNRVSDVAKENVRIVVGQVESAAPILNERVKDGRLKVVGAFYHVGSGAVEIIDYPSAKAFTALPD